jgi:Flp pilus assembly pilin Flp
VSKLVSTARRFIASEDAASMVEYGLLVALILIVLAVVHKVLGLSVASLFNAIAGSV